ncbi:hypothetical protein BTUL_0107g00220 [Botrytis tulipae]|uniref:Uncharacterized protein n=1 Tax=Botrytis tulipae TaxID=87230 RepID=A0A4Z1ELK9_9HELO|nr:hypothetical protein BTUL_0107g00220 [Botrytis tulipae]
MEDTDTMRTRQREKNPTCACISDDFWAHGDLVALHRGMTSSPKPEPRSPDQTIKPSNHQTIKPSNHQSVANNQNSASNFTLRSLGADDETSLHSPY